MRRLLLPLLLLSLAAPAAASPITMQAGDVVSLTFGTMPANWDPTDPPDYLEFSLSGSWLDGGTDHVATIALYDGDRLLASRTNGGIGMSFLGATQERPRGWTPAWAAPFVDFTSMLDGTIDGRIDVSFAEGGFVFDPDRLDLRTYSPNYIGRHPLMLYDVTPDGGFWAAQGDFDWIRDARLTVTPAEVITPVPEPGTLSLVATGLGVGFLNLRKRRKAQRAEGPRSLPAQHRAHFQDDKISEPYLAYPPKGFVAVDAIYAAELGKP